MVALRSLGAALACAVVASLSAALPAAADVPAGNVATPVDYWPACWPDATTVSCYDAVLSGKGLAQLGDFIGKPVSLQVESAYTQEQYDIVLM